MDKASALQGARVFGERDVKARQCVPVITSLLYLKSQGETFTTREATDVFFSATRLFQHQDRHLRRLVYLLVREFASSVKVDEVIIIISSLMKDMASPVDLYRANSIRVLCSIVDAGLLPQVERYIKQALVDSNPVVAAGALISAHKLAAKGCLEVVRRWAPEIGAGMDSPFPMVQLQAVTLMHALRQNDKLGVSKLIASLQKGGLHSAVTQTLLVRYVARLMRGTSPGLQGEPRAQFHVLEAALQHSNEMVIFEAARQITQLPRASLQELQPAMAVLQMFLNSPKPVVRLATVRAIDRVAAQHPAALQFFTNNVDLEALVADSNQSIATLAIATLLKTGTESSVDRLLKQINDFIADISDDFKVVVVQAIKVLCLKFPHKHRTLMVFLASALREEGGFEFKRAIVESILSLIEAIPEAKEPGLGHLCEFIEDCEFAYLSTQILHLLGEEAPLTREPSRYTRFIYNRIILENASIRAAAVSALYKLGREVPLVRPNIVTLLDRALTDNDDEVRDRAAMSIRQLTTATTDADADADADASTSGSSHINNPMVPPPRYDLAVLEDQLATYLEDVSAHEKPFTLEHVPVAEGGAHRGAAATLMAAARSVLPATAFAAVGGGGGGTTTEEDGSGSHVRGGGFHSPEDEALRVAAARAEASRRASYAALVAQVPELKSLGSPIRSTPEVPLLEEGMEYRVGCVKHVYDSVVVLQFSCVNSVPEQVLENVSVAVDLDEAPGFKLNFSVPLAVMPLDATGGGGGVGGGGGGDGEGGKHEYDHDHEGGGGSGGGPHGLVTPGYTFVCLQRPDGELLSTGSVTCTLTFTLKEVDPSTGECEDEGYEDEYGLEAVVISPADYMKDVVLEGGHHQGFFQGQWEKLGSEHEVLCEYALGADPLPEVVGLLVKTLGMTVLDRSDVVAPGARSHTLLVGGEFLGREMCVARVRFGVDGSGQVALQVAARSTTTATAQLVHDIITSA